MSPCVFLSTHTLVIKTEPPRLNTQIGEGTDTMGQTVQVSQLHINCVHGTFTRYGMDSMV